MRRIILVIIIILSSLIITVIGITSFVIIDLIASLTINTGLPHVEVNIPPDLSCGNFILQTLENVQVLLRGLHYHHPSLGVHLCDRAVHIKTFYTEKSIGVYNPTIEICDYLALL